MPLGTSFTNQLVKVYYTFPFHIGLTLKLRGYQVGQVQEQCRWVKLKLTSVICFDAKKLHM